MQRLEFSGAVRPIHGSLSVKRLRNIAEGEVLPLKYLMNLYVNELSVPALCTHQGPRSQMSRHSPSVIKSSDVGKV